MQYMSFIYTARLNTFQPLHYPVATIILITTLTMCY